MWCIIICIKYVVHLCAELLANISFVHECSAVYSGCLLPSYCIQGVSLSSDCVQECVLVITYMNMQNNCILFSVHKQFWP